MKTLVLTCGVLTGWFQEGQRSGIKAVSKQTAKLIIAWLDDTHHLHQTSAYTWPKEGKHGSFSAGEASAGRLSEGPAPMDGGKGGRRQDSERGRKEGRRKGDRFMTL